VPAQYALAAPGRGMPRPHSESPAGPGRPGPGPEVGAALRLEPTASTFTPVARDR
jgi:hypothetical protein